MRPLLATKERTKTRLPEPPDSLEHLLKNGLLRTALPLACGLLLLVCGLKELSRLHRELKAVNQADQAISKDKADIEAIISQLSLKARKRIIYPYSIVPGGLDSVSEFYSRADQVARAHYGELRPIRMVNLPRDQAFYVSFRKDQRIQWTRKRLMIPAGERLVELGGSPNVRFARARCGNLLSDTPQAPVLTAHEDNDVTSDMDRPALDADDERALASALPYLYFELPNLEDIDPGFPASTTGASQGNKALAANRTETNQVWPPLAAFPMGSGFFGGGGAFFVAANTPVKTPAGNTSTVVPITPVNKLPVTTPEPGPAKLFVFALVCAVLAWRLRVGTRVRGAQP